MYFSYGDKETEYLKAKDRRLGEVIDEVGHIYRETDHDLFSAVVHQIIGQQISTKAQATVWKRIQDALGTVNAETVFPVRQRGQPVYLGRGRRSDGGTEHMRYEGVVYRPPSEARSLIVQVTVGCSHNRCTFCTMYKEKRFRMRSMAEICADFDEARRCYGSFVRRIFLADGDALAIRTEDLLEVLSYAKECFPDAERISCYATPADINRKGDTELAMLRDAGLDLVYMGAESGDDVILRNVCKGATSEEIIAAGKRLRACGMKSSVTLISGLGGRERLEEHALASADLISRMNPEYVGFLTLMLEEGAPILETIRSGKLTLLEPPDVAQEMRLFLKNVDSEGTVFRSNHASNYIVLRGTLNTDIPEMLSGLDEAERQGRFRPEGSRLL